MASTTQGQSRLQNKIAIVTGGASGIGRAIALRFASEGAHVVIADKVAASRSPKESELTHDAIQALGQKSVFIETDVTSAASVDELIRKTVQEFGRLDIMCNNAGAAFE
jgi:NAD(P)-dependent dehydrogenase (short-subunit alcohol dehydrogenase family)